MGNGYIGMAMLSTHPCFKGAFACLVCPLCEQRPAFMCNRVKEFEVHFMSHSPDEVLIERWMSGKFYDKWKKKCQNMESLQRTGQEFKPS
jgi:hypothetical protein